MGRKRIVDRMELFMAKVIKPEDPRGCWLWTGMHSPLGYARFYYDDQVRNAHRFSYREFVGPLPNGQHLHVDHLCRNRGCVNPAHLELVTRRENIMRGVGITADCAKRTHCIHGHEFTKENTLVRPNGRGCRACANASDERWNRKRREIAAARRAQHTAGA